MTESIHTTEELLIIALFLSWTKWGLFELLWSLDTAGRICSHFSPLWSHRSPCLQFTSWSLFIDHQAVRIKSEKAIHDFTHFMAASRNSEVLWSAFRDCCQVSLSTYTPNYCRGVMQIVFSDKNNNCSIRLCDQFFTTFCIESYYIIPFNYTQP